ncbi:MAG: hypothetical protein AB7K86_08335 [Rhodospirillales bacterium]
MAGEIDYSRAIEAEFGQRQRDTQPLGAAPETPKQIDYGAALAAEQDRASALRRAVVPTLGVDPDRAARLNAISRRTGIPVDVVGRNEQTVEQSLILDRLDAIAASHPRTGEALSDPRIAAVAHDDAEQLGFIERQVEAAKSGWSSGKASRKTTEFVIATDNLTRLREIERKAAAGEYLTPMDRAFASLSPDQRAQTIADLERKAAELRIESAAYSLEAQQAARKMNPAVQQALNADDMGTFWQGFMAAPLELLAALPVQSTTQNPATAIGFLSPLFGVVSRGAAAVMALFGMAAVSTSGAATEFGAAVLESLAAAGVDTTKPDAILAATQNKALMDQVRSQAITKASVITAFDTLGMGISAKVFNPGHLTGTNIGAKVAKEAGNVVVQAGVQGALGGAGEVLGSAASGQDVQAGSVMAEVLGGGAGAIGNVALMSGLRAHQEVTEAQRKTEAVKGLMDAAAGSKLRERDPEAFREFAERLVEGGAESVWVASGALSQAAQSSPEMDAIVKSIPSVATQMREAGALGTDIEIPTADLMAKIAGTPLADQLLPHLRLDVTEQSIQEAQAALEAAAKAVETAGREPDPAAAASAAFAQSQAAVTASILADIEATGTVTRQQARVQATLAGNMFAVLAGRLGVTPEAVYREMYALRVTDGQPTATQRWNALVEDLNDAKGRADEVGARRARIALDALRPAVEAERQQMAAADQRAEARADTAQGTPSPQNETPTAAPPAAEPAPRETSPAPDAPPAGSYERIAEPQPAAAQPADQTLSQQQQPAAGPAPLAQDTGALGRPEDRGQIAFGRGVGIDGGWIRLLEGADISSFFHEMGHFYLEVLSDLDGRPNPPDAVREDFDALLGWFGVTREQWAALSFEEKRPYHEQFARGFEAFLFEGRAPTKELRGAFSRIRAWMMSVYRSLTDLGVNLTDEVRGVFDRMIAGNNQLQDAAEGRAYLPVFKSAAEAGMTDAEYAAYLESGMDQTRTALEELHGRALRDMQWLAGARGVILRRLQREAKEKRQAVEAEVRTEIMAEPLQVAIRFIKTGDLPEAPLNNAQRRALDLLAGGETKLSSAALREIYGDGPAAPWRYLPTNMKSAQGGAHPDTIAAVFGFTSGDEMVRAILAEDPLEQKVQAAADERMIDRYGDISSPEALDAAVNEALQNAAHVRFLATEHDAMQAALAGGKAGPRGRRVNAIVEAARRHAEAIVARIRVRDLSPSRYTVSANRAAREAEQLWKAGNRVQAADAKRNQILNAQTAREVARAQTEVERIVGHLRTLAARPSERIAVEYRDQIDALLERFEFRARTRRQVDRAGSLADYLTKMDAAGLPVDISDRLRDEAFRAHYSTLTVGELRDLNDAVTKLEGTGRRLQKLRTAKGERDAQAVIEELVATIRENGGDVRARQYEPTGRVTRAFRGFLADHRKFASIIRQLDGNVDAGPLWTQLARSANASADHEANMREQSTEALAAILDPVLKLPGGLGQKVYIPMIRGSLSRAARLAVALNHGNEGNRQRLRDGHGWNEAQVEAILSTLTREEWTAVQAAWDHIESFWQASVDKIRRLNGTPPEKVEADAFTVTLADGSTMNLRGGYYPAAASTELSTRASGHDQAEAAQQMMRGAYVASTTRRGHLKERTGSKAPLELSLDPLFRHVNNVTHDLAFHEWLIDANRVLRDPAFDRAVRDHYPAETLKVLHDAVNDIAAGDTATMTSVEKVLMLARRNVSAATMGWSLTTALMQPFGLSQSIVRIGPRWVFKGMADAFMTTAKFENAMARIGEQSTFMRLRAKTFNRELAELHGRIRAGRSTDLKGRLLTGYENSLFLLMQKLQMIADVPTWLGAKEKALAQGEDEASAIALADQAVIDAQGSGMTKDLARIQRRTGAAQMLTMFYSYFNTTYNLTAESVAARRRQLSEGQYASAAAGFAADMTLLYVVPALGPALVLAMLQGDEVEDDEWAAWVAKKQLSFMMATVVGLREFGGLVEGYPYAGPPALRIVSDTGKAVVDEGAITAFARLTGDALGVPVTQIIRSARGWLAYEEGDAPPTSILFGPPPRN